MDDGRRFYERPVFWPRLIGGILLLIFVIAFRSELLLFLRVLLAIIQTLMFRPVISLPPDTPKKLIILLVNLIVYLGVYFLILKMGFVFRASRARFGRKAKGIWAFGGLCIWTAWAGSICQEWGIDLPQG